MVIVNFMHVRYLALLIAPVLGGCGLRSKYIPLNPAPHELHVRMASDVQVLEAIPQESHVEIGTIEVTRTASSQAKKDDLYAAIREIGARHGCDAVRIAGPIEAAHGFRAACVVFTNPSEAPSSSEALRPTTPSAFAGDGGSDSMAR